MSNKSFTNKILDPEERGDAMQDLSDYGRQNRRPLIVGAIFGLLLGLFIGWVVWPTQWTNTWPPDLAEPAKADYIAAVADAFVASRSDEAADLAYQRLSSFGDEMEAELANAALFFEQAETSDSAVRVSNIQELAVSVRPVPTPEVIVEAPEGEAWTGEEVEEVDELEDQVVPVEPTDSSNWLQLALWLLAAFVLIAGGIWVLRSVMRSLPTESASSDDDNDDADEIDEFDDEDLDSHGIDHSEDGDTSPADDDHDDDADFAAAATVVTTGAVIGQVISDEEDPDDVVSSYAPPPVPHTTPSATADSDIDTDNPSISVRAGTAGAAPDSTYLEDQDSYGFGPETDLPAGGGGTTVVIDTGPENTEAEADDDEADPPAEDTIQEDVESAADAVFLTPGREVNRYKAIYYPMLDEYEEAFRIEDAVNGGYIGDCGMGVNMKYGFVQNNPEQVTSLDVWLIDLVKEDNMSFHAQTLVSKYGVAHLPDAETDDDAANEPADNREAVTLTSPKTGDRFQIVGENLLVDCEVISVSYMESGAAAGVFKGLEVNMVVSRML